MVCTKCSFAFDSNEEYENHKDSKAGYQKRVLIGQLNADSEIWLVEKVYLIAYQSFVNWMKLLSERCFQMDLITLLDPPIQSQLWNHG